ncbi:alaS [Acrasis kona]|uniref:AlaS n=1 Tax=Acrasis kona TaxID=1008807 RepID=A0AAW2Z5U2_9EUKA
MPNSTRVVINQKSRTTFVYESLNAPSPGDSKQSCTPTGTPPLTGSTQNHVNTVMLSNSYSNSLERSAPIYSYVATEPGSSPPTNKRANNTQEDSGRPKKLVFIDENAQSFKEGEWGTSKQLKERPHNFKKKESDFEDMTKFFKFK